MLSHSPNSNPVVEDEDDKVLSKDSVSIGEKHHSLQTPDVADLDFNAWAASRLCIPDDGRFEFAFSRTRLKSLYNSGKKAEAEHLVQRLHDFMTYQVDTNRDWTAFFCRDYYERVDGHKCAESVCWSRYSNGLEKKDIGAISEVKDRSKLRFQRFMQISGLDFAKDAHEIFAWQPHDGSDLPSSFGTQTHPNYNPGVDVKFFNNPHIYRTVTFTVIWYSCGFGKVPYSVLSHGPLYGSVNARLVQKRIEVFAMLERSLPRTTMEESVQSPWRAKISGRQNWTIVASSPPRTWIHDGFLAHDRQFGIALVAVVQDLLERTIAEWGTVIDHIETLLAEGHSICSPRDHDHLLVDDENLTRSRKYFWIMTSIDEFSLLLDRTVQALEKLYEENVPPILERDDKVIGALLSESKWRRIDYMHDRIIKKCKKYMARLEEQKGRTEVFRSGLFNASAVIESRQASRLSKNVMLLTYVSIFYIPLNFISSLWAVPNTQLQESQLAYVMVSVGVATYVLTFNINTVSRVWKRFYYKLRDRVLESMKRGTDIDGTPEASPEYSLFWEEKWLKKATDNTALPKNKWEARAERYENTFQIVREKSQPSEWFIAIYLVRSAALGIRKGVVKVLSSIASRNIWRTLLKADISLELKDGSTVEKGLTPVSAGEGASTGGADPGATDTNIFVFNNSSEDNPELALAWRLSILEKTSSARSKRSGMERTKNAEPQWRNLLSRLLAAMKPFDEICKHIKSKNLS